MSSWGLSDLFGKAKKVSKKAATKAGRVSKKAAITAGKAIKKAAKNAHYQARVKQHELVMGYLKRFAERNGLTREEKGAVMDARRVLLKNYPPE